MHDPAHLDTIVNLVVWFWLTMFALVFLGGPLLIAWNGYKEDRRGGRK